MRLYSEDESGKWIHIADEVLISGISNFMNNGTQPISQNCLKATAQIGFCMQTFASLINICKDLEDNADVKYFVDKTKQLLKSGGINEHDTSNHPVWFLTCFIVRHFGVSNLLKTVDSNSDLGILPLDELKQVN